MPFRFTLVGDGSTDSALVPIIDSVLKQVPKVCQAGYGIEFTLGKSEDRECDGLAGRIEIALREFPCHAIFVHRDAEDADASGRLQEIADALASLQDLPQHVAVVPVRMTEAWLLIDIAAIRKASDNPTGRVAI